MGSEDRPRDLALPPFVGRTHSCMWCRHPLARPLSVRASTVPTPLPPSGFIMVTTYERAGSRALDVSLSRQSPAAAASNIDVSCLMEDDGTAAQTLGPTDRMPRHFARFSERNLPVVIGSAASEWPVGRPVRATPSSVGRASLRTVVGRSAGGYNKNTSQPTPHPTTELDSLSRTFAVARSLARLFANSVAGGAETGGCPASLSLPHAPSE